MINTERVRLIVDGEAVYLCRRVKKTKERDHRSAQLKIKGTVDFFRKSRP
ncbi:hypothetical protein NVP1124O_70, partial [Vibrio phage 1.124.O._10N.286.49.B1]